MYYLRLCLKVEGWRKRPKYHVFSRPRSIALVFSTPCDIITPSTYASQYAINYFVALYFGYIRSKVPYKTILGLFFLLQRPPKEGNLESGWSLEWDRTGPMILFPASNGFQVASFSVLTRGPNDKKGPKSRPMKCSPKIRATRSLSTYNDTYV